MKVGGLLSIPAILAPLLCCACSSESTRTTEDRAADEPPVRVVDVATKPRVTEKTCPNPLQDVPEQGHTTAADLLANGTGTFNLERLVGYGQTTIDGTVTDMHIEVGASESDRRIVCHNQGSEPRTEHSRTRGGRLDNELHVSSGTWISLSDGSVGRIVKVTAELHNGAESWSTELLDPPPGFNFRDQDQSADGIEQIIRRSSDDSFHLHIKLDNGRGFRVWMRADYRRAP